MTEVTQDTTSKTNIPVIKTDLVSPLKALEIYQEHLLSAINDRIKCAERDLKECNAHKKDPLWDRERFQVEEKIRVCRDLRKFVYIPHGVIPQIVGRNYYFTRKLQEEQKKIYSWRNRVILNDNLKCRKCGQSFGLEAHHIYSFKLEPDLRFDPNNGITLCYFCHKEFHKQFGIFTNMEDIILFLGVVAP